jgi:hypothetical protein
MDDELLIQNLIAAMQLGNDARDFCKHPIYKELEKWITRKVEEGHKEWMACRDKEKREQLWYTVQPYQEFQDFLKRLIIAGDTAAQAFQSLKKQEEDLQ